MIKKILARSAAEMDDVAELALKDLLAKNESRKSAALLLLSGELGAGKTTFAQAVGKSLGVTERMTSPTFVIQKEYQVQSTGKNTEFKRLIHIDAYRLESFADLELLGWHEFVKDPQTLILLEWPEQVRGADFAGGILLKFLHLKDGGREILFNE